MPRTCAARIALGTALLCALLALPARSQVRRQVRLPHPPAGIDIKGRVFEDYRLLEATILDVPPYLERYGSGPTAVGMVLGYHDGHGFPYLFPGDAAAQTDLVNMVIASEEHYNDYALPLDTPSAILPDKSVLPAEERHADNCLADHLLTSRSVEGNAYGWTKDADLGPGVEEFFKASGRYVVVTQPVHPPESSLAAIRSELLSGRPPVFSVDTDGDGQEDRFVAVAGVNSEAGINYYGCYTGWDTELHWYELRPAGAGISWGVATVWMIAPGYEVLPPVNLELERLVNDLIFFKEYINRLTWEPNPENLSRILRYKIYRKESYVQGTDFGLLAEVDVSSNGYDDRGLQAGIAYTYRVTAVDELGREGRPATVRGPK